MCFVRSPAFLCGSDRRELEQRVLGREELRLARTSGCSRCAAVNARLLLCLCSRRRRRSRCESVGRRCDAIQSVSRCRCRPLTTSKRTRASCICVCVWVCVDVPASALRARRCVRALPRRTRASRGASADTSETAGVRSDGDVDTAAHARAKATKRRYLERLAHVVERDAVVLSLGVRLCDRIRCRTDVLHKRCVMRSECMGRSWCAAHVTHDADIYTHLRRSR